jgi:thiamine pyrophosphokinase
MAALNAIPGSSVAARVNGATRQAAARLWPGLSPNALIAQPQFTLLVLNARPPQWLERAWPAATRRVITDGGVNHMFNTFPKLLSSKSSPKPDLVIGDMDSADPQLLDVLVEGEVEVKYNYQDSQTDLDKALAAEPDTGMRQPIVVSGRFNAGIRFDHSLSIVNSLAMHAHKADVICVSDECAMAVLAPGSHLLPLQGLEGQNFGIFPLEPLGCTTRGLRYNVAGELRFGNLMPGNVVEDEEVHVETTGPLLITVELNEASVEAPKKTGSDWDVPFDFYSEVQKFD